MSKTGFLQIAAAMLFLLASQAWADAGDADFQAVARQLGPRDSAAVFDPKGAVVFARNADQMQIPASTFKLLTAACALAHLGPEHRFATDFYLNAENDLIIKGYGDPLLISEQVADIAKKLGCTKSSVYLIPAKLPELSAGEW